MRPSDSLLIPCVTKPIDAAVTIPGSKSYTNRALIIAALADGESIIREALLSDDTAHMGNALRELGIDVDLRAAPNATTGTLAVRGCQGSLPRNEASLFVGNAGTAMRFLTSFVALGHGHFEIDGAPRMRERPIQDLLEGLAQMGVRAYSQRGNGCPPVVVEAHGIGGGVARMRGDVSSQYFTSLLLAAPYAATDVSIEVEGPLVSRPYLDMTIASMASYGVQVLNEDYRRFRVAVGQPYAARDYTVEPDASNASYFFAAAALTGGRVRVLNLPATSAQGDVRFARVLAAMGCTVNEAADSIEVVGAAELDGIEIDLSDMPDLTPTLAAVAPFAKRSVTIRGVGFIRHHETDRLRALATELRRLGASVKELADGLVIEPSSLHGCEIETYDDHRIAMAFAVTGLRVPGVRVRDPDCVRKTFPDFFTRILSLVS